MAAMSGKKVLGELDHGLSTLRGDLRSMDSEIADSGRTLRELGDAKLTLYRRLAEHHLAQVERGDVIQGLESLSHRIRELLDRREREHRDLLENLREAEARLAALETQRESQREQAEAAAAVLDEREADVQERLENDPAYQAQLGRAHEADAVADQAEAKTEDAVNDKQTKGEPYENDRLFMYLWERGYGTSAYSANPLSRFLDRWVANLVGYDKARPNYWMLNEIPRRLRAHAENARARSDAEFEKLEQLELAAAEDMGVAHLEQALDAAERSLSEIDEAIAGMEGRIADMGDRRSRFAAGDDELMAQALDELADEMESDGINALRRQASLTPDREDDRIVRDIVGIDERLDQLDEAYRDRKKVYARHLQKARELENLRGKFKRLGYDDMRSEFSDGAAVTSALAQFLRGLLDDDDLWRLLARSRKLKKLRADPTFGSGGFPHRPGTWRWPRPGTRLPGPSFPGTGSPFPRMPRPRRGGFGIPSGGGFRKPGGGGFSTGGGF
jgi:DNA repair exonuclease SbcCD ATPase subunit